MSNKTQLQENNKTLEFVLGELEGKPTTEECMAKIYALSKRVIPISQGGTGATTVEKARENLGIPNLYMQVVASDDPLMEIKGAYVEADNGSKTQAVFNELEKQFRITMDGSIKITGTARRDQVSNTTMYWYIYLNDKLVDSYYSPWGTGSLEQTIDKTVNVKSGDVLRYRLRVGDYGASGYAYVKITDFWIKGQVKFAPMVVVEA